ncbi:MAG: ABC transporter substrate-binding protein [Sulfitobacter sp.]
MNFSQWSHFGRAATLVVAASFGTTFATETSAESIRIAVPSGPGYLDPAYWGSTVDALLIDNLYPHLVRYAPGDEWNIELSAASSVDTSDPMNIAFELKPGIMWTGGYGELTAEDVEYSFERHLDPDVESGIANEFSALNEVEVTGKYTGIIRLNEPSATFWTATVAYTGGAIISKAAAEEAGGYFESIPVATAAPYMPGEFDAGGTMKLVRNPDWNGDKPYYDEIVLIPIADENASELAFSANEIDFLYTTSGNYDALVANPPADSVIELKQTLAPLFLGITSQNEALQDYRVRRAIQLAVDIPSILQATTGGHAKQATGFAAQGQIGYRDQEPIKRDVEQARALLAEAGAEGLQLRLDYTYYTERDTAAQILQANLAEVGISLDLNGQDEATFWAIDDTPADQRQLHLKSWNGNPEPAWIMQYFVENQVGTWNWETHVDPEYDELLAQATVTADDAARGEIYKKMQTKLADSGNFIFLSHEPTVVIHRKGIEPGMWPDGSALFEHFRKAE